MRQNVRIIGGLYRGKKIYFPAQEGLRPTPDRVKETLFNWLMQEIRGSRCLDAFAGSGALGFEAFSRGAKRVVMVESSPAVYTSLQQALTSFNKLDSTILSLVKDDAMHFMQTTKEIFDIIFLDPPFATQYLSECLNFLAYSEILIKGGLLYVESPKPQTIDSLVWREKKMKQAGQVNYALYEKC